MVPALHSSATPTSIAENQVLPNRISAEIELLLLLQYVLCFPPELERLLLLLLLRKLFAPPESHAAAKAHESWESYNTQQLAYSPTKLA